MAVRKAEALNGNIVVDNPMLPGGLIPIEEWTLPGASVSRTLIGTARYWLEQLGAEIIRRDESFESLDGLPELSAEQLKKIAPEPDYNAHGRAIAEAIQHLRNKQQCRRSVLLIVAPPFSGIAPALRSFTTCKIVNSNQKTSEQQASKSYRLILPPTDLLMSEEAARQWWQKQSLDQPWVISELAVFWRRHHDGLMLVQELLRLLATDAAGEGVIGCNSWCWQFWSSYCPEAHLTPWAPAPLTEDRLGVWLQQLACCDSDLVPVVRMATDGLYVLPPKSTDKDINGKDINGKDKNEKRKYAHLLRNLAADSRGIPGVALAIWQRALRARPDADADDTALQSQEQRCHKNNGAHSWVVPLDQLRLPVMPISPERNFGLLLHALLLHDGLTTADLALVTAIAEPDLSLALSRLQQAGILKAGTLTEEYAEQLPSANLKKPVEDADLESKVWRVTPLGYPATRRHLQSWGFPLDVF